MIKKISTQTRDKFLHFMSQPEVKETAYKALIKIINMPFISDCYNKVYQRQISKRSRQKPHTLVLEPYNVCNLRCIMCPYPLMSRKKEKMSMALYKKIIDDASKNGFKTLSLSLYNEPFLDDLLFDRIKYAKKKDFFVIISSNGTSITDAQAEKTIKSGVDCITFSIDSFDKHIYESIRVNAVFEKTLHNVKKLMECRKDFNVSKPLLTVSAVKQSAGDASLKQMKKILSGLDLYAVSVRDNRRDGNSSYRALNRFVFPCWAIWNHLVVYSSGKVGLCCMDYDNSLDLGDLNEQSIEEIWNSQGFLRIKETHLAGQGHTIKKCTDCDILYRQSPLLWWLIQP